MAEDNFYDILGVNRSATQDEIRKAYRRLAKEYHPDRNPEKSAEEKLKRINEAYDVLGDPEKRANYDRYGTADFQSINMDGFGDIFSNLFRSFGGFGDMGFGQRGRAGPPPGQTLRMTIKLSFDEAFFGTEKEIAFKRKISCENCGGSGAKPGTAPTQCRTCGGQGQVFRAMGGFRLAQTCPTCGGLGEAIGTPCPKCRGQGLQDERKETKVPIPPGVEDGQGIRIQGGGNFGPRRGPPGDLILMFTVGTHDAFVRRGLHVYLETDIPFSTAAMGGEVEVPTMWGNSVIKVKKGTESGTLYRMKGKGVHTENGRTGDQLVRVNIYVPQKLSKEQQEYLSKFEDIFS